MSKLFQNKYRIKSNRLKGWDYSGDGEYFVTICTKNKQHFFGEVVDEKMHLNLVGKIAEKYWQEITKHFPFVMLDQFCVMPDHIHAILFIRPDENNNSRDAINRVSTGGKTKNTNPMDKKSLGEIIRWFKGRCTFEVHKLSSDFQWQPRFHDRIIRSEKEYFEIQEYILANPAMWGKKKENLDFTYD